MSGNALVVHSQGAVVLVRAGGAKGRHADHHNTGVHLRHLLVGQLQLLQRFGHVVLDEDVAGL